MHRTNQDSLRSCPCFRVFRLNFAIDFFNLLLVRIPPSRDNCCEASHPRTQQRWELNHQLCDHGLRENDAPNHSATSLKFLIYRTRVEVECCMYSLSIGWKIYHAGISFNSTYFLAYIKNYVKSKKMETLLAKKTFHQPTS